MRPKAERIAIVERARERAMLYPCIGWYARDDDGRPTGSTDENAVGWCGVGALRKECGVDNMGYLEELGLGDDAIDLGGPICNLIKANDSGVPEELDAAWSALIAALPDDPVTEVAGG